MIRSAARRDGGQEQKRINKRPCLRVEENGIRNESAQTVGEDQVRVGFNSNELERHDGLCRSRLSQQECWKSYCKHHQGSNDKWMSPFVNEVVSLEKFYAHIQPPSSPLACKRRKKSLTRKDIATEIQAKNEH